MPNGATALLGIVAVGGIIAVVGLSETASAAGTAASTTRRVATSTITQLLAGIGIGLELGNQLLMAISAEPFALTTAIAGIMGALGIEGVLGDISGLQFLLIGFSVFLAVYYIDRRVR